MDNLPPIRHTEDAFRCGAHINEVVAKLHAEARRTKRAQVFAFNGTDIVVRHTQSIRSILCGWKKSRPKYRPARDNADIREFVLYNKFKAKCELNTLMETVPDSIEGWLNWMAEYVEATQLKGVWRRSKEVTRRLKAMGWVRKGACNLPVEEYNKHEIAAAWIAGQILSCLHKGYPPHPVLATMARDSIKSGK